MYVNIYDDDGGLRVAIRVATYEAAEPSVNEDREESENIYCKRLHLLQIRVWQRRRRSLAQLTAAAAANVHMLHVRARERARAFAARRSLREAAAAFDCRGLVLLRSTMKTRSGRAKSTTKMHTTTCFFLVDTNRDYKRTRIHAKTWIAAAADWNFDTSMSVGNTKTLSPPIF